MLVNYFYVTELFTQVSFHSFLHGFKISGWKAIFISAVLKDVWCFPDKKYHVLTDDGLMWRDIRSHNE